MIWSLQILLILKCCAFHCLCDHWHSHRDPYVIKFVSWVCIWCFGLFLGLKCLKTIEIVVLQILVEVDRIQDVSNPYLQIKGVDKEAVAAAGSKLKLDGSYTTKVCLACLCIYFTCMWFSIWVHFNGARIDGWPLTLMLSCQSYLQIILERLPVLERSSSGIHTQQAARLQELVELIQSQVHNRHPQIRLLDKCYSGVK